MSFLEVLLIAIGLAMDAFAVSVAKGFCIPPSESSKKITLPALFGLFQGLMPFLGAIIGIQFAGSIDEYDHWIIFLVLGYLGVGMIRAAQGPEEQEECSLLTAGEMFLLAIATSIDALAVGVSLAFLKVDIYEASIIIGVVTFILCVIGTYSGKYLLKVLREKAEAVGGIILILVGIKILLSHLGIIPR